MKAPTGKLAFAYRTISKLEAERDQLRAEVEALRKDAVGVASGLIVHAYNGSCPDAVNGHDKRDEDCPACQVILRIAAAPAAPVVQHSDDAAVDRFAAAMKEKLAAARAKGRAGWDDPNVCPVETLAKLLISHLRKGNAGTFEDVANFAMMLHQRGADPRVLAEAAPVVQAEPVATILPPDPLDERSGSWLSLEDWERLQALPAGTKLYAGPAKDGAA